MAGIFKQHIASGADGSFYYPHRHTNDERNIPTVISAQDDRIAEALSIINDQLECDMSLLGEKLSACDYFLFMLAEWSLVSEKSPTDL